MSYHLPESSTNALTHYQTQANEAERQNCIVEKVGQMKSGSRCANTAKAYDKRRQRYKDWCTRTETTSGFLVTETKLLDFLISEVVPSGNIVRSRRGEFLPDGNPYPLSASSIDQYFKAVVDLHADQKASMVGITLQEPRGTLLKSYLRSLRLQEVARLRRSYRDRGAGGPADGYTPEECIRVSMYYFNQATENALRDRAVFLMQHMMILRGESTRRMELPDLFMLDFEDQGYSPCPALVLLMREGKTNHTGKMEYAATIRNNDFKQCAFGALAFYFFARWHINGEPFPSFARNENWFDIKVLKSSNGSLTDELNYKTQYNSITKAFEVCKINSSKKTHAGRKSGTKHAEISGATEDQLRRHGRWNSQSMENNYLTSFPRESILIIDGFSGVGKRYYLPRSIVTPPESLQQKIFPWVETILPLIEAGYEDKGQRTSNSTSGYSKTICGQAFLKLLKCMRTIILQDAVFFRVECPENPIFQADVFRDPEFVQFEAILLEAYRTRESPLERRFKDVVPELDQALTSLSNKVDTVTGVVTTHIAQQAQQAQQHQNHACCSSGSNRSQDIADMRESLQEMNMNFSQLRAACSFFVNGSLPLSSSSVNLNIAIPVAPHSVTAHPVNVVTNSNRESINSAQNSSSINSTYQTVRSGNSSSIAEDEIPHYKMQRWIKNVKELWHEYSVGFKSGTTQYPSIKELEASYKNKWRNSETERKFFSRRMNIIQAIEKICESNGDDAEAAVKQIEDRRHQEKNCSLNKLNEILKKEQNQ